MAAQLVNVLRLIAGLWLCLGSNRRTRGVTMTQGLKLLPRTISVRRFWDLSRLVSFGRKFTK